MVDDRFATKCERGRRYLVVVQRARGLQDRGSCIRRVRLPQVPKTRVELVQ